MVVNLISSHPSAPQDPTSKNQLTARMARGLIYGIRSLIELIYGIRSFSVKIVTSSLLVHKNT
jgi:hypothetical protein